MSKGRELFSQLRLEGFGQEGREPENGGAAPQGLDLGEDGWLTSHDEEEQHGFQCSQRAFHPRSIPGRKRQVRVCL